MKHMTIEEREKIEGLLKEGYNFTYIAKNIGYHRTTIAEEIIKHKVNGRQNAYGNNRTFCCKEELCNKYNGVYCTKKCTDFIPIRCSKLEKPPYVCNGCTKKQYCRLQKYFYRAKEAQEFYNNDLVESRVGVRIPEDKINKINEIIAPLIVENGQTVNQVYINYPDILDFSKQEFYRLIDIGAIKIKNIDLPRKVSYKKGSTPKRRTREESIIRENRTYNDFLKFKEKHKNLHLIEMDCVIRVIGGKVLLTMHFVDYEFMFMFLLEQQTKEEVMKKINWIRNVLGKERYKALFNFILTDNGHEFFDVYNLENIDLEKVTNVFYCDPSSPEQKGSCEENHHYLSYIVPKDGNFTFDNLTQEDVNLIMSHVNSVPRECIGGLTPYDAILEIFTKEELTKLGVSKIDKDKVILKPHLLGKKTYRTRKDTNNGK